jgi:hypothetical protein
MLSLTSRGKAKNGKNRGPEKVTRVRKLVEFSKVEELAGVASGSAGIPFPFIFDEELICDRTPLRGIFGAISVANQLQVRPVMLVFDFGFHRLKFVRRKCDSTLPKGPRARRLWL